MGHKLPAALPERLRRHWLVLAVILVELVFLLGGFVQDRAVRGTTTLLSDSMGDMVDHGITHTTQGTEGEEGLAGEVLATRWLKLEPGMYNVTVAYLGGGDDVTCYFYKSTALADTVTLRKDMRAVTFQVLVPSDQEEATLRIATQGSGFTLESIVISYSQAYSWYNLLCRLVFFLAADLIWLLWSGRLVLPGGPRSAVTALGLGGAALIASLPLLTGGLIPGHDLGFHLNRIEGLAQGLASGQLPVRIQPFWLDGRGYAVSVFYGDLLLYFPAVLRFFGVSVQGAYKVYTVAVNLGTALVSWYCLRRMLKNDWAALFGSVFYTLSIYRIINIYLRGAVGEYTAMLFLPLVFYGLWRIFTQPDGEPARPRIWLPAVIGFSGLIQTHLLSCEIVGMLTLAACVVLLRRTLRRNTFFPLCKVVGITALLNLWFLLPLFDYLRGDLVITTQESSGPHNTAAYLGQMLGLSFSGVAERYNLGLDQGTYREMAIGLGLALLLAAGLFVLVTAMGTNRRDPVWKLGNFGLWAGLACLILASDIFPWDNLYNLNEVLGGLVAMVQYVWRFLSPGTWFWALAGACAVCLLRTRPDLRNLSAGVLLVLTLVSWGGFVQTALTDNETLFCYSAAALDSCDAGAGEYLPAGTEKTDFGGPRTLEGEGVELTGGSLNGLQASFTCSSEDGGAVIVPILHYPYYYAVDEAGTRLTVTQDPQSKMLRVEIPAGYSGRVEVGFAEPWFWRAAEAVSLLTLAGVVLLCLCRRGRPEALPSKG